MFSCPVGGQVFPNSCHASEHQFWPGMSTIILMPMFGGHGGIVEVKIMSCVLRIKFIINLFEFSAYRMGGFL